MTFTTTPPTTPGFYAWRRSERDTPEALTVVAFGKDLESPTYDANVKYMKGQWCRLVPAEEVEKAWFEVRRDSTQKDYSMKSPQEQAEELLKPLINQYKHTEIRYDFESKDGDAVSTASTRGAFLATRDALALTKKLPLPELIAVAMAAANLSQYAFMEGSKQRHADLEDLMVKVEALRATGKVEL